MFRSHSIDRAHSRWEEHLYELSPVEDVAGLRFKREDKFAPLGYGGINGSKLRQCIWLVDRAAKEGRPGLLSGASVKSPQISMGTLVATHFGLQSIHVVGATNPRSAIRHENVRVAAAAGARFRFKKVAYNPVLQREVASLLAGPLAGWMHLEYGISVADDRIEPFHRLGSEQVRNLPDDVDTLVMPAGSCNSCVSVLYGIARYRPKNLKRVVLLGIGPNRIEWLTNRLETIEKDSGVEVNRLFTRRYHHNPELEAKHSWTGPMTIEHYDLHTTKFASYQDEMPYSWGGVDFHPTYEGKLMNYMSKHRDIFNPVFWRNPRSVFWIVGSRPTQAAMAASLPGAVPPLAPEYLP